MGTEYNAHAAAAELSFNSVAVGYEIAQHGWRKGQDNCTRTGGVCAGRREQGPGWSAIRKLVHKRAGAAAGTTVRIAVMKSPYPNEELFRAPQGPGQPGEEGLHRRERRDAGRTQPHRRAAGRGERGVEGVLDEMDGQEVTKLPPDSIKRRRQPCPIPCRTCATPFERCAGTPHSRPSPF